MQLEWEIDYKQFSPYLLEFTDLILKCNFLTLIKTLYIKETTNITTISESLWDHCKNHLMMLLVTIAHHRTCYSILMVLTLPHMPFFLQVEKPQKTT